MVAVQTKRCCHCKKRKPLSEFHRSKREKDGHRRTCKECRHALNTGTGKYAKKTRARAKEWREAHLDYVRACGRGYVADHKEEFKEYKKQHYEKNKQKYKDRARSWKQENNERYRQLSRRYHIRRREREAGLGGGLSHKQISFILAFWDRTCAACGKALTEKRDLCIDHWLPLSRGHKMCIENAVVLCQACNNGKNARYPGDYFKPGVVRRIEQQLREQATTAPSL